MPRRCVFLGWCHGSTTPFFRFRRRTTLRVTWKFSNQRRLTQFRAPPKKIISTKAQTIPRAALFAKIQPTQIALNLTPLTKAARTQNSKNETYARTLFYEGLPSFSGFTKRVHGPGAHLSTGTPTLVVESVVSGPCVRNKNLRSKGTNGISGNPVPRVTRASVRTGPAPMERGGYEHPGPTQAFDYGHRQQGSTQSP